MRLGKSPIMTYNGYSDFDKFFVINHIELPFGSFKAITKEYEGIDGERFFGVSSGSYELKLEITLMSDKANEEMSIDMIRREVLRRISTRSEQELKFSTLPNVKFKAVPDGSNDLRLINPKTGKAEITFKVPEGYSKETILTTATAKLNEAGVLSMEIDYDGTVDTPLNLKFVNNDETGYLSALGVNNGENTFLTQLGYVDEVDGETRTRMSTIFPKDGGTSFTNWTDATAFYENQNKKLVTAMQTTSSNGGWLGGIPTSATSNGGQWYGAAKELILPTPTAYCYLWGRAWFETGLNGQTGIWTLAMVDENNQFICGMSIEKADTVGNSATIYFLIGDGNGMSLICKRIPLTPSYWIPPNPYGSQARDANRNMFDLRKEGQKVTFFWYGQYYTVYIPEIISKKVKRIQFFTGQYNGRTTSQLVSRMAIRDVLVIDLKSQYWQDIPNRFLKGSIVETRKENGMNKIYRDGIATLEDLITGSTFPMLKPGKNTIEFYYSGFTATPPTVTATYEKRWY
ncbi:distal tail protein Dit [Enterococcus italicus]|uniref:distal tail protein Dit n=1 Tax=Enterococcus italicus TaxID=246144 RepID=UPI003F44D4D2